MEFAAFKASLAQDRPPAGLSRAAQALWWDAKGDWPKAHRCAQQEAGAQGAWVHAYLHRREGDAANAGYWYRRAAKKVPRGALAAEWKAIARAVLAEA